jgi:hypothetical protein
MSNFFYDVIAKDPRFRSPNRCADLALLEPNVRRKVLAILADAKSAGVELMVYETFRSQARQQQLYRQGATKLYNVGVHGYGLAADIVKVKNGQPSWDGDFSLLGKLARGHNLIWGGDWGHPEKPHSFVDDDHVQWCSIERQQALFARTWYPDGDYNPYDD